jgi:hypothetical protein
MYDVWFVNLSPNTQTNTEYSNHKIGEEAQTDREC